MKKSLFSIILFSFSIFSFAQNNQEAIIEECLRLGNTIAKFQSYEKELNDIKQKKKKNYYSKGEEPIQMLNYKLRKYIKKEFTDIEWKYFTSSASAVDNWASGLENKFSKEMGMESVGGDNKTVSLRYTQSKEAAFKAYDEDKTKLNVNCDVEGAGNQKSKKKSRTKTKSKKKTKNPEKVKKKKE